MTLAGQGCFCVCEKCHWIFAENNMAEAEKSCPLCARLKLLTKLVENSVVGANCQQILHCLFGAFSTRALHCKQDGGVELVPVDPDLMCSLPYLPRVIQEDGTACPDWSTLRYYCVRSSLPVLKIALGNQLMSFQDSIGEFPGLASTLYIGDHKPRLERRVCDRPYTDWKSYTFAETVEFFEGKGWSLSRIRLFWMSSMWVSHA